MKKLVTLAVALAAASAMAAVTSDNIVGYRTGTSKMGMNWVAPDFTSIGENAITLKSIALSGDGVTSMSDDLQILDADGAMTATYVWFSADDSDNGVDEWFDMSEWASANDIVLAHGDAVAITTANPDVPITVAGEVSKENVVLTSVAGMNWLGNVFPTDMTLSSITLSGDGVTSMSDDLQILDPDGAMAATYVWFSADDSDNGVDEWFDMSEWASASDTVIPAGLGVAVTTANPDVTITVVSPIK